MAALVDLLPAGISPGGLGALAFILALSGIMSGLSGFGFSAIGAVALCLLPPALCVPLLMVLSTANQMVSIGQLRADLRPYLDRWRDGPIPYLLGGSVGAPLGVMILQWLPTPVVVTIFGAFLVCYALYSLFKPESLRIRADWGVRGPVAVGFLGGVIGGFTAFPGAAVVIWCNLRKLPREQARAIVQPYILALQILSLLSMAVSRPQTFDASFGRLVATMLPIVLPSTILGLALYRRLSDVNFRRSVLLMLGTSGATLVLKALGAAALFAVAVP